MFFQIEMTLRMKFSFVSSNEHIMKISQHFMQSASKVAKKNLIISRVVTIFCVRMRPFLLTLYTIDTSWLI